MRQPSRKRGKAAASEPARANASIWSPITRTKVQLVRDRVRLHNQLEALLEETRIKLSSVVSELLGLSGLRILRALAQGQTDPVELARLGDRRLRASQEELADALRGRLEPCHREMLHLFLERLEVLNRHAERIDQMAAAALEPHQDAVLRLSQVPGFGPDSAQQTIAEVGPYARSFDSSAQFASWAGLCPGRQESAGHNHSSRSAKGNPFLRRILTQAAQAAVKTKGSHFQKVFRRWLLRLGYQRAIWALAHKLARVVWKILHDRVGYAERGESNPTVLRRRAKRMLQALRAMGYQVMISSLTPQPLHE